MSSYNKLLKHVGHKVVMVHYGEMPEPDNIAIECEDCGEVLMDFHWHDRNARGRRGIGVGECSKHGEYFLDAPDSPCPSCEDEDEEDNDE